MIVEQYGIRYKRITESDIELIRYWRNQPFIKDTMQYKEYITAKMQQEWFKKINNKYNYYFLIEVEGKKIGLINCKDTEPNTRIAEGGIFIWDKNYWDTPIPVFAALTMLECVFEIFKSGEASIVTVTKENKKALQFNKFLGYKEYNNNLSQDVIKLILTKETYYSKTCLLKRAAKNYSKGNDELKIIAETSNLLADEINEFLKSELKKSQ